MESDLIVKVNRKQKVVTRDELENFSKEDLINRIIQLETHNIQLKNIIKKSQSPNSSKKKGRINVAYRDYDFSKCYKRHVLLKIYYLGWDYQGFAVQEDTTKTIEHHVFDALIKTCLIKSRETSNYHRCGRTDKGVSAFSQTISIDVRSKYPIDKQMDSDALDDELQYCEILNRVLPKDIRCIAWMPLISDEYSARFNCKQRTYRYFFPRGELDIEAMREGCRHLIGIHDFRNFCKMDVGNGVITFIRDIRLADIVLSSRCTDDSAYDVLYFEICGQAFLWHQIRCIIAILILIGQHNEQPDIITSLLDVKTNPCTPQYSMATYIPLNLYKCEFKEIPESPDAPDIDLTTEWIYNKGSLKQTISILQGHWTLSSVKSSMMLEMLRDLQRIYENELNGEKILDQPYVLLEGVRSKTYKPLLNRIKCKSLENRIEHYTKKRRIDIQPRNDEETID